MDKLETIQSKKEQLDAIELQAAKIKQLLIDIQNEFITLQKLMTGL